MSSQATKAPRRKPTEIRQTEIVDAGMRILATDGARHFTAERIATAVGISSGTIFRHFTSMEQILDAIVERIEEVLFAGFPPKAPDALKSLRLFFDQRVRAIREHPEISRLLLVENLIPSSQSKDRQRRLRGLKRKSQRFVRQCLDSAAAGGQLADDVGTKEATRLVLGAIHSLAHTGQPSSARKHDADLASRVWNLLERALIGNISKGR